MESKEIIYRIDKLERRIKYFLKSPISDILMDVIETTLEEIKVLQKESAKDKNLASFRAVLDPLRSFVELLKLFLLNSGTIEILQIAFEDIPKWNSQKISRFVRNHHYPSPQASYLRFPHWIKKLDYKIESLKIKTQASQNLSGYNTEILVTDVLVKEIKEKYMNQLKENNELVIPIKRLINADVIEQHVILSILSNPPQKMIVTRTETYFKVLSDPNISLDSETVIYSIKQQ